MTIRAAFAASFKHLMASAFPVIVDCSQTTSAGASGPATTADRRPRPDGAAQLKTRRMILEAQAKQARDLRQSKAASIYEAELRAVTLECLRRGL